MATIEESLSRQAELARQFESLNYIANNPITNIQTMFQNQFNAINDAILKVNDPLIEFKNRQFINQQILNNQFKSINEALQSNFGAIQTEYSLRITSALDNFLDNIQNILSNNLYINKTAILSTIDTFASSIKLDDIKNQCDVEEQSDTELTHAICELTNKIELLITQLKTSPVDKPQPSLEAIQRCLSIIVSIISLFNFLSTIESSIKQEQFEDKIIQYEERKFEHDERTIQLIEDINKSLSNTTE